MTGEEALLSLLKDFPPLPCMGCGEIDRPMIEAVLGDLEMHDGSHLPAAVYRHGMADDGKPHWERKMPIRAVKS